VLTENALQHVLMRAFATRVKAYHPTLVTALRDGKVDTPLRTAMFLAHAAVETSEFRWMSEIAEGTAYEPLVDPTLAAKLGNTQTGDGRRYLARGALRILGRKEYEACGRALGLDLLGHPEIAGDPEGCFRVAVWKWNLLGLSPHADAGAVDAVTRALDPSMDGIEERHLYYRRACEALGC